MVGNKEENMMAENRRRRDCSYTILYYAESGVRMYLSDMVFVYHARGPGFKSQHHIKKEGRKPTTIKEGS